MPSTYTLNNGIELIGSGEQSGTWGDTTNTNLSLIDTALDGQVTVTLASAGTSGSPNTLPISDGAASNGRNRMIVFDDGGDLGATAYVQLTPNDAEKIIYVRNALSGSRSILLFQGTYNASNDYEVPAGTTAVVYFDGAGAGAVAANVFNNAYFDSLRLGDVSVAQILDEDDLSSDSAGALATQQSIKAYVDNLVGAVTAFARTLLDDADASAARSTLGLGNAATATVQSSATDSTSGRLLTVGAFGLGADEETLITNFGATLRPGLYRYLEATTTDAPGPGASYFGSAIVSRPATDGRIAVLAHRTTTATGATKAFFGARSASTGTLTWKEIYHQDSILGTVSQSGGTPTGAVIEQGSNANGEYTRFADGTQICFARVLVKAAADTTTGNKTATWTYPATFVSYANTFGLATVDSDNAVQRGAASHRVLNSTTGTLAYNQENSSAFDVYVTGYAIGRWF